MLKYSSLYSTNKDGRKLRLNIDNSIFPIAKSLKEMLFYSLQIASENEAYQVNLFFIEEERMKTINYEYRKKKKVTDVLSFPFYHWYKEEIEIDENEKEIGDIFICFPLIERQTKGINAKFEKRILLLFVHGLLHLLGYDHEEEVERKIMFSLQREIINKTNNI